MFKLPVALTLALAVSAGPAAAAVSNGTYKGSTSQDRTVHAKVKNGKIKSLTFSVYTLCGIGGADGAETHPAGGPGGENKEEGGHQDPHEGGPPAGQRGH